MSDQITYDDKADLIVDTTIDDKFKVSASDMNEIKNVVNSHADDIDVANNNITDLNNNKLDINAVLNQASTDTDKPYSADYLNDKLVSVGTTAPENGERVWFKNSRNLIEPLMATATSNGVTCTNNGDGSFTLNGTATANATFRLNQSTYNGSDNLKSYNGIYTLSCNELENGLDLRVMQNSTWISVLAMMNSNTPVTGSINKDNCFTYINVANNKSVNNLTIRPMLQKGSVATGFEPYVNPSINVDGEKWIDKVNDTGWIDITSYVNTSNFAVRPNSTIRARRIGNIAYLKGEIYCKTALSTHYGNIMNGIPSIFRPIDQYSRCGVKYDLGVPYNIFIAPNGNITVSESQNISETQNYMGYQLTNLSGYIVD